MKKYEEIDQLNRKSILNKRLSGLNHSNLNGSSIDYSNEPNTPIKN